MADQNVVFGDDDSPSWLTASRESETQITGFGFTGAGSLPAMEWTLSAELVTESGGVQDAAAKSYGLQLGICNGADLGERFFHLHTRIELPRENQHPLSLDA
ncbi:hypothetical protein R1sor_019237 [Riccia sorocarpa]|uniref:Uncharacterized protein n=1 Tax=Riccia sorocarpa TaxID=122646 RepID=A0ABD3IFK9_9MARC